MRKILVLTAFTLALAAQASAQMSSVQPFGLKQGMTVAEIVAAGGKPSTNPGYYRFDTVPNPNSSFDFYLVKVSPKQGLCRVSGLGKTFANDSYGDKTRGAFDSLEKLLNEKYGKNKHYDFLKSGSIWDEPRDWMMSINKTERYYTSFWGKEESSDINDGLLIMLDTRALDSSSGYISLAYEFSNMKACTDEINAGGGTGL